MYETPTPTWQVLLKIGRVTQLPKPSRSETALTRVVIITSPDPRADTQRADTQGADITNQSSSPRPAALRKSTTTPPCSVKPWAA